MMPKSKINGDHIITADSLIQLHPFISSNIVVINATPCEIDAFRTLIFSSNAVFPIVTHEEVATRQRMLVNFNSRPASM